MTAMLFDFPSASPTAPPKKKPIKQGYTGEFLAFWELYPSRFNSSKFLAFKAWSKLDDDEQRQAMIAAPIYANRQRGKDEQYTQHASTWINGKYFETMAAPMAIPAAPMQIDWPRVLQIYKATGRWNAALGGEPGTADYKGPK